MDISILSRIDALTGNGDNRGTVTIASTAAYYVGAQIFLRGDTAASREGRVMAILSATQLSILLTSDASPASYERSDVSAYTTADNAKVFMPSQLVYVPGGAVPTKAV